MLNVDNIPSYGLANVEILERLVSALQLGPWFPAIVTDQHVDHNTWTYLRTEVRFNELLLAGDTVREALTSCLVNAVRTDLLELFTQGDTESEDKLLGVMDGLRKRTEWPSAFVISQRLEVSTKHVEEELCVELGLYVTATEGDA